MKALQVVECPAGGVLRYLVDVCNILVAEGVDVEVAYSLRPETPETMHLLFPQGVRFHYVQMSREISPRVDARAVMSLWRLIRAIRPDVIHAHSSKAGVLARAAGRLAGSGTVLYTPHGYSFLRSDVSPAQRTLYLLIERLASAMGGVTVASSAMERAQAIENKLGRTAGLYHAVPLPNHRHKRKVAQRLSAPVIGTSGRISAQKNPSGFARTCHEIRKMLPAARFVWIGDGELRDELEREAQELEIDIEISGWLSTDLAVTQLGQLDLYLHTALWEAWPPYSVLEAMSYGLPVVALSVQGVSDDMAGSIRVAETPESLAAQACWILSTPETWRWHSRRTLEAVAGEYSMAEFASSVKAIYGLPKDVSTTAYYAGFYHDPTPADR